VNKMKKFFLLFLTLFSVIWMSDFTHAYAPTHANQTPGNSTNGSIGILSANEPIYREIIADGPWRVEPTQQKIPIYVLVKDAGESGNPSYYLDHVEIWANGRHLKDKYYGILIDGTQYALPSGKGEWLYNYGDWYDTIMLDRSGYDVNGQWYDLSGKVNFQVWVKDGLFSNWDSYFETYFSSYSLPHLPNWYAGDTHYHSSYSDNYVEFGGPINTTVKMGKAIGIDWAVITDHSFDLDDVRSGESSNHKWSHLKNEFSKFQNDPSFKAILGEEISAGNGHTNPFHSGYNSENVHLLCYNLTSLNSYIQGDGDDLWDHIESLPPSNNVSPTITLQDAITQCNNAGGIAYAGHPGAVDTESLDWLNRGRWFDDNVNTLYNLQGWTGLQIWNTIRDSWSFFDEGKILWLNQLRQGRKSFIAGGSDAHGDFSNASYFQPDYDLDTGEVVFHNSSFARVRTYIYTTDFSQNGILNALRKGNSIITDGPLVTFTVYNPATSTETIIGGTAYVSPGANLVIDVNGVSSNEFGSAISYTILYGVIGGSEYPVTLSPTGYINIGDYPIYNQQGYFRLEATSTDSNGITHRAYTNPIWVEVLPADTTPPSTPSLISPSSGYSTNNPTLSFSWSAASDTDSGVKDYQIQIDNNNDFSSPAADAFVSSTSYSTSLSDNLYYWRVRARDNANNLGLWTSSWSFTIDSTSPTVTVISPNGGESWQAGTSQLIRWSASDNIGVNENFIKHKYKKQKHGVGDSEVRG